ncbi:hypothetical protein [Tellurirhabdus bombi]|uniref:hypothetical protein n=1 Tax=Tellurirhabdus bombi TaxID=2907205 RepID=UPI001F2EEBD6|nr:hypothetical protein [Tellurirhabdus bombi]
MATLSDTSDLLDTTIDALSSDDPSELANNGTPLLDQWITVLQESENTHELAGKLQELKQAVSQPSPQSEGVQALLNDIADQLTEFSAETGSEGEMPSQLQSLAAALRNIGNPNNP